MWTDFQNYFTNWFVWKFSIQHTDFQLTCNIMLLHTTRRPPSWILKTFVFGQVTVTDFWICICLPNFIKIGLFFRWDMAVWRFSRWRISAVLNVRSPIMDSLQIKSWDINSCKLLLEKIAFLCTHFGDRQTMRRTDGQSQCVKSLLLYEWRFTK